MEKRKKYIAYGSNLNLEQMARRCPTARVVGKGEIKEHELLFRGSRFSAVATVEPKAGASVPAVSGRMVLKVAPLPEDINEKFGIEPSQYADFKSLTGDVADNIKGADKVGPKPHPCCYVSLGILKMCF